MLEIEIDQAVSHLNFLFGKAQQRFTSSRPSSNVVGTELYTYQVEFCYKIDDIQRGPRYIIPKRIQEAHELIKDLNTLAG